MVMEMVMHGSVLRSDRRTCPRSAHAGSSGDRTGGGRSAWARIRVCRIGHRRFARRGSAIRPADRPLDPPKTVSPVLSVPDRRGDARLADAGRVTIAEPL